jgi:hypothetical protein
VALLTSAALLWALINARSLRRPPPGLPRCSSARFRTREPT